MTVTVTVAVTPQNPILKAHSKDPHDGLIFHARVEKVDDSSPGGVDESSPIPIPITWTWWFENENGKFIDPNGRLTKEQKKVVLSDAGTITLQITAPRFTTAGRYTLYVTAQSGAGELSIPDKTWRSEMQVVSENFDERNSFISYGADGNYYLVSLGHKDKIGGEVITLPGIPDGFADEDVGLSAPLARSIPKTVGATFITCVMVNLQSKDNHKLALLSKKNMDAMADKLGSSSTKVQK
jgi:hypothetical protein